MNEVIGLFKLMFTILLIGHLFACLWHGVAFYHSEETWLHYKGIENSSMLVKYNYAFYWATMTMITVGYGDIIPQNNLEVFCASVTMLLACAVFGYSINSIGNLLSSLNSSFSYQKHVQASLKNFFMRNQVSLGLQKRIKSYIEYVWKEEQEIEYSNLKNIIEKLSSQLQNELQYELKKKNLQNCVVLKKFSEAALKEVALYLEEVKYSPEEIIIRQDTFDDCSLYLLIKGETFIKSQEKTLNILKVKRFIINQQKGQSFGEYSFFTGQKRQSSVQAKEFTNMYKIQRNLFIQIIQTFQKDFVKQFFLLIFYRNYFI